MFRALALVALLGITLSGCQALADAQARQEAERQAQEDALRARIAQLTPEQKDRVQRCSSIASGRIDALRMAGQGAVTNGMTLYTVVYSCLGNPYYYETIPAAPTQVIVNTPPEQNNRPVTCNTMDLGGGMATTTCK